MDGQRNPGGAYRFTVGRQGQPDACTSGRERWTSSRLEGHRPWRTALPIRQALVRQHIGLGGKVMQDQQAMLSAVDERYIIAVEGLPGMYAGMIEAIGAQTMLEREGKSPIMATQGLAQLFDKSGKPMEQLPARGGRPAASGGGGRAGGFGAGDGSTATLIFGFPKSEPITAADKDIEFAATIGTYHLKHKFHLKDMVLNGEPSL